MVQEVLFVQWSQMDWQGCPWIQSVTGHIIEWNLSNTKPMSFLECEIMIYEVKSFRKASNETHGNN